MAIDALIESLITPEEAAKIADVHPKTIRNWTTVGVIARNGQRVWLEDIRVGVFCRTSREALDRFFVRCTKRRDEE
ncbi:MAG: hypothetical protein PHU85_14470 [Phycisphaerae bacterium]|nr:hypothetical protein [Phycisphaerae bacterium]